MQEDPWVDRIGKYEVGQLLEGTITRLTKFGAFARIEEDLEGLIHISEISERRIEHPKEVLKEGETVTLRVIKIEPENHRVGLSIRRVDSMAFAEMDWKTLEDILLDEVELDDEEVEETEEAAPEVLEETVGESQATEETHKVSEPEPTTEEPEEVQAEVTETEVEKPVEEVKPKETEAEESDKE